MEEEEDTRTGTMGEGWSPVSALKGALGNFEIFQTQPQQLPRQIQEVSQRQPREEEVQVQVEVQVPRQERSE